MTSNPSEVLVSKEEIRQLVVRVLTHFNSSGLDFKFFATSTGLAFEERGKLKFNDGKFYFDYNNNTVNSFVIQGQTLSLTESDNSEISLRKNDWLKLKDFVSKMEAVKDANDAKRMHKVISMMSIFGFGLVSGFIMGKKFSISLPQ